MKPFISSLLIFAFTVVVHAAETDALLVRPGDAVDAVRSRLGEPEMEFPLNGRLIQDYGSSIITSSNGVVVSVRHSRPAPKDPPPQQQSSAITIKVVQANAEKGDAAAQYLLGYCYQSGTAVEANLDKAIRWYTLAAMQGHADAQHNLSLAYLRGTGVEKDLGQAYTWAYLAAENGNEQLKNAIRSGITGEQEEAARARAIRIRNGQEPSPYGTPDESTSIVNKTEEKETAVD